LEFLKGGAQALERNWQILSGFAAANAALGLFFSSWSYVVITEAAGPLPDTTLRIADLVRTLLIAASYAAVYSVGFALMGRDIDRPLWKLNGANDALRRFFTPWFLILLVYFVPWRIFGVMGIEDPATAFSFLFLMLALETFIIPTGACIMFAGQLDWEHLGAHLMPIVDELPRVFVLLVISFFAGAFSFIAMDLARPRPENAESLNWMLSVPAISALGSIVTLFIFAAMWEVLRIHRDTADHDDLDF